MSDGKQDERVEDILLWEIRQNRLEISRCRSEIAELKLNVFSNKVKLGSIIVGLTLAVNVMYIFIAEKVKLFLNS